MILNPYFNLYVRKGCKLPPPKPPPLLPVRPPSEVPASQGGTKGAVRPWSAMARMLAVLADGTPRTLQEIARDGELSLRNVSRDVAVAAKKRWVRWKAANTRQGYKRRYRLSEAGHAVLDAAARAPESLGRRKAKQPRTAEWSAGDPPERPAHDAPNVAASAQGQDHDT